MPKFLPDGSVATCLGCAIDTDEAIVSPGHGIQVVVCAACQEQCKGAGVRELISTLVRTIRAVYNQVPTIDPSVPVMLCRRSQDGIVLFCEPVVDDK